MGRLRLAVLGLAGMFAVVTAGALARADVESNKARARAKEKPWLGIVMAPGGHGVEITEVIPLSPADTAGMQVGDQLFELDGQSVASMRHLHTIIKGRSVGDPVSIRVWRAGAKRTLHTTLSRRLTPQEIFHSRLAGNEPPPIEATLAYGDSGPDLSAYRGDLVLIGFWGGGMDLTSARWLSSLADKHADSGLVVLGVSQAADYALARWGDQKNLSLSILSDAAGKTHERYQIGSKETLVRPTVYVLVGRDGKVLYGGNDTKSKCLGAIESALEERNGLSVD